jgi:hypothetical protein
MACRVAFLCADRMPAVRLCCWLALGWVQDTWYKLQHVCIDRDSLAYHGCKPACGTSSTDEQLLHLPPLQVQSWTPQLALQPLRQSPANKYVAVFWNMLLVTSPIMMGAVVQVGGAPYTCQPCSYKCGSELQGLTSSQALMLCAS